jgi:phage terminase Nu1 subunit (DNA packaging protein)
MEFTKTVGSSDLATILGITTRRVEQLANKGILKREGRGSFDLADNVQAFVAHRESVIAAEHGVGDFGRARADLYRERAKMARLQREEIEGSLIPTGEVIAMNTSIAAVIKQRMLAVGPKLAPRLTGLRTPAEAQAIVSTEIEEGLTELAQLDVVLAGRKAAS